MSWYLILMFALPLLELWDKAIARFSDPLRSDSSFDAKRWVQVLEGEHPFRGRPLFTRVWIFRIPYMRTWGHTFRNFDLTDMDWREHHLIVCWQAPPGKRWRIEPPLES